MLNSETTQNMEEMKVSEVSQNIAEDAVMEKKYAIPEEWTLLSKKQIEDRAMKVLMSLERDNDHDNNIVKKKINELIIVLK